MIHHWLNHQPLGYCKYVHFFANKFKPLRHVWNDDTAAIAPYQTTLKQAETISSIEIVIPSWVKIVKTVIEPVTWILMNDKPTFFPQSRHVHQGLSDIEHMFTRPHIKHNVI